MAHLSKASDSEREPRVIKPSLDDPSRVKHDAPVCITLSTLARHGSVLRI